MLGGQYIQDDIAKMLRKQDCGFLARDCSDEVELLTSIEANADKADVIIIHQLMLKNLDGVLFEIRALTKRSRIILILNGPRNQYAKEQLEAYRRYCMEDDFIYEQNRIDAYDLLKAILRGALDAKSEQENAAIPNTPEKPEVKLPEKPPAEKRKKSSKEPKPPKETKPPKAEKQPKAKPRSNLIRARENCCTIAVFGSTRGAGVTNMVHSLAEFFALSGKRVLAVNLTDSNDFEQIDGKADYSNEWDVNIIEAEKYYDLIIYDAGVIINVDAKGVFRGLNGDYACQNLETVKYGSLKIVMSLSDPWHIKKCEYYLTDEVWSKLISNDYIFLFDNEPDKALKRRFPYVNIYNRNDMSFVDKIAELVSYEEEEWS